MKLFTAVNRKIKFSEKDYVERNYIREDGKAVIPIELDKVDSLYMKHDLKKLVLTDDVCNYIKEVASIIPFKYDIVLQFHCHEISIEEQERIRKIIKNNFGMDIDDIDYENRMSRYISVVLFILGVLLLLCAYALPNSFWQVIKEILFIAGWVTLWEMLESLLFTNNKRKIERLNKLQLYDSQVEFVFDKIRKEVKLWKKS